MLTSAEHHVKVHHHRTQRGNQGATTSGMGGSEVSPMSSLYAKGAPGQMGAYTARGPNSTGMGGLNNSLPANSGTGHINMTNGSLSFMGKTTLFSRVAISPNNTTVALSKNAFKNSGGPFNTQNHDADTNATTNYGGGGGLNQQQQ